MFERPLLVGIETNIMPPFSGWSSMYNGLVYASEQNVVFVSINYRVGVFGKQSNILLLVLRWYPQGTICKDRKS